MKRSPHERNMVYNILIPLLIITLLSRSTTASSQVVLEGWYYLPQPASNVWGIGYHQPQEGKTLSYVGNELRNYSDSDLLIQAGPKSIEKFRTKLNSLAATSLFKGNKAINFSINSFKVKQVILSADRYKTFDDGNFYVTQALKADSVVIKGFINKSIEGNSTDAEKLISDYASSASVALQVVNTLTGKDTTKESKGIVQYSDSNKDSFIIVITNPDVFFAVKLTQVVNINKTDRSVEIGKNSMDTVDEISDDPKELIYASYKVNRGLYVGVRFAIVEGKGVAEVFRYFEGDTPEILAVNAKVINNSPVHFQIRASTITPNVSQGKRTAKDYFITAEAAFTYDPNIKRIVFDGLDGHGLFQTSVYHVTGRYTTWPK